MRTKEKFYDNLSKFQVSDEKKKENFELKPKRIELGELQDASKLITRANVKAVDVKKNASDLRSVNNEMEFLTEKYLTLTKQIQGIRDRGKKLRDSGQKARTRMENAQAEMKEASAKADVKINKIQKSASGLGIDVPEIKSLRDKNTQYVKANAIVDKVNSESQKIFGEASRNNLI